jgi:hypothetical protein
MVPNMQFLNIGLRRYKPKGSYAIFSSLPICSPPKTQLLGFGDHHHHIFVLPNLSSRRRKLR